MFDICFYHFPCSDGITSAWCVKRGLPNIYLYGVKPGVKEVNNKYYNDKSIVFVDCCPSEDLLDDILIRCKNITILDHHITNKELIEKYQGHPKLEAVFDMDRAGCQITWDYFFPTEKRYWFVDYVADRDLWKFELENSKLINLALFEFEYLTLEGLYKIPPYNEEKFIKETLLPQIKIIEDKNKRIMEHDTYKTKRAKLSVGDNKYDLWLGCTSGFLVSDFGHLLYNKKFDDNTMPDCAAIWKYDLENDLFKVSLRGEKVDVSKIAKHFGGGGHKAAAGFEYKGKLQDIFSF